MRPAPKANEEGRRLSLQRFGYQAPNGRDQADPRRQAWARLKSDFTTPGKGPVPDYDALDARIQFRVEGYIEQRVRLDRLMDACDAAHLRILKEGPLPLLVEAYAAARDAYEEAVEDFAALRELVQEALDHLAPV